MSSAGSTFQQQLDSALAKIRSKLSGSKYIFVSSEPERGLGLEKLLPELTIAAIEQDSVSAGLNTQGKFLHLSDITSTGKLGTSEVFRSWLNSGASGGFASDNRDSKAYIQFFKNTSDGVLEELEGKENFTVLNNTASLTRALENKVSQFQWLEQTAIAAHLPQSKVARIGELEALVKESINGGVVVQLPFGHTGSSTFMITSVDSLKSYPDLNEQIKQYPNRACRVVEMIHGQAFTVNGCIYGNKVLVAGLSYQYTGISGLTNNPATTVGNDWMLPQQLLSQVQIEQIRLLAEGVGMALIDKGFRGFFGIDLVVDQNTGKPYLIEINPRQIASVPMHTKLQLESGQLPLAVFNLAEFLGITDIVVDSDQYNRVGVESLAGAQIFLRSSHKKDYQVPDTNLRSGIYRQQSDNAARELEKIGEGDKIIYLDSAQDRPLIWQKEGVSMTDFDESGFLLLLRPSGYKLQENDEVARIQARFPLSIVSNSKVMLKPLVGDCMHKLSSILLK
jgi:hypothetical protein